MPVVAHERDGTTHTGVHEWPKWLAETVL